ARPAMAPCRCYRRHRRGGEALLRGDLHLALPVLSHRNFVRPRYGDPCGLPARAIPRSPRPRKGLDRHLHGSGHHHRVCLAWPLAYREGQLPTRDLSAQITGQTRISTLGSNSCCAPDASAADDAAVGPDPSTLPARSRRTARGSARGIVLPLPIHDMSCAENRGLASERYGAVRPASPQGLGPEGAARAEGAVLVKVIEYGRQARTEHLLTDVAQQLGHEDSADAGEAGVVVGEAGAPGVGFEPVDDLCHVAAHIAGPRVAQQR